VLAKLRSHRPRHATFVAYLALFVALGGSSYAAITVTGKNVKNGSLTGKDVKNSSLTTSDVRNRTLLARDFKRGQLPAGQQGPKGDPAPTNAITGANVADRSLTTADLAGPAVNAAVSLSGIPNGRCDQVTFNVSGAQVGDTPLVTTRAAIQNGILMYGQRVASAGHVEVNACNFSGTTMTAISGFPVRVVALR
jgi:hypothetical protein